MGGRRLYPYWLVSGGSARTESGGGMRGLVERPAYAGAAPLSLIHSNCRSPSLFSCRHSLAYDSTYVG
jgi:hypothetical protein